jgi:hypothetical protein
MNAAYIKSITLSAAGTGICSLDFLDLYAICAAALYETEEHYRP